MKSCVERGGVGGGEAAGGCRELLVVLSECHLGGDTW